MNGGHLVYLVHFNGRLVVSNTILWIVTSSLLITMPIEWHIEWFNMPLVPLVCELFTNKQISEWIWICEFVFRLHRFKLAEMGSKTECAHVNECSSSFDRLEKFPDGESIPVGQRWVPSTVAPVSSHSFFSSVAHPRLISSNFLRESCLDWLPASFKRFKPKALIMPTTGEGFLGQILRQILKTDS